MRASVLQQSFQFLPTGSRIYTYVKAKYVKQNWLSTVFGEYEDVNNAQLDFLQHLAHEVFGSFSAIDLFSNEYSVALAYANAIGECANNVNNIETGVSELIDDSIPLQPGYENLQPGYEDLQPGTQGSQQINGGKAAVDVLQGLLHQHKTRFDEIDYGLEGEYVAMPIRKDDVLQFVFTIHSSDDQTNASGDPITVSRKALIEIKVIEG